MNSSALINQSKDVSPQIRELAQLTIESAYNEGIEKGISLVVKALIENCPEYDDEKVALIANVPVEIVKKMRKQIHAKSSSSAKKNRK